MANFPVPPHSDGDIHEEGGVKWSWDGLKWVKQDPTITTADVNLFDPTHPADAVVSPLAIPDVPADTTTQFDVNKWFVDSLRALDGNADVSFFSFYRVVHPDDFTGEAGTVGVKTDAYGDPNVDQFLSPNIIEFDFANVDLVGKGFPQTEHHLEENLLFDFITNNVDPNQMNSVPNGTFEVTSRLGFRKYGGQNHMGAFWHVHEGDILAVRTPSVWEAYRMIQTSKTLQTTQEDLVERVSEGEEKQETIGNNLQAALIDLGNIEDTVTTSLMTQNGIKTELVSLHNKVEALEGAVIDAKYDLSTLSIPDVGEFQLYASGTETLLWDQADSIKLYRTDAGGNPHTFDPVGLGDIIRIGGQSGSAVYEVASAKTTDGDTFGFDLTLSSFTGTMVASTEYEFTLSPAFDASAYVTKTYVDQQDNLKLNLTGGDLTGTLRINCELLGADTPRFYMKAADGNTNLTIYPSGLVESMNIFRVKKESGDCYQVKDVGGGTVKWKVDADGVNTVPKIVLTGDTADINKRVIDVKQGEVGRLAYDSLTKMSWGTSNVWIGSTTTTGEDDHSVNLNLQGNSITDVGSFTLNHTGQTTGNKFAIKGETDDGPDTDVFYSYKNNDGTTDAVNYKGRMTNEFNLVNKGYVDTQIATIDLDGSEYMPLTGDTFTGKVTFNTPGSNDQVNFAKSGNNNIQYKNTWIVSFQGDSNPKIKLNTDLNCNNNYIANVKDPSSDTDAVNRRSLEGAKVASTSSSNTKNGGFYESGGRLFYKLR